MARTTIRKVDGKWTVTRPGYGFTRAPTTTVHPTHVDAIRSMRGGPFGSNITTADHAGQQHDGIATITPWTPLWELPGWRPSEDRRGPQG